MSVRKLSFYGWQTILHPEELTLLSLLKFRRTKSDFTYNSREEHFAISKFLEEIIKSGTDQRWVDAANNISVKKSDYVSMQPPSVLSTTRVSYGVRLRWASKCNMKSDYVSMQPPNDLSTPRVSYGAEFVLDHSKAGNEAHKVLNNQKLNYMERFSSNGSAGRLKRSGGEKPPSTPSNKIRIIDVESSPHLYNHFSDNDNIAPIHLENIFFVTQIDSSLNGEVSETQPQDSPGNKQPAYDLDDNNTDLTRINIKSTNRKPFDAAKGGRKYINLDLADEVLKTFQMHVLPDHKLIYGDVDVMTFARSTMKTTKKSQISKSPLSIGVIDIHNAECLKYLPQVFKKYIADQVQNADDAVHFSEGKCINKFLVDCEEEVLQYLEKFYYINDLKSLEECLDKNRINHSTSSNDLIYVENLFLHFLFLYKNEVLTQTLTETEFNAYVWTPMFRNAFLGKADLRLKCGEVASRSYDKLKEILNIATRSGPRLDGKGFLKSLGTEILAQEDGAMNTQSKRTGDLQKLIISISLSLL
ncbi:9440_t:CDS:2 [Funneliformis geosporum]|nr:9440_t:CDS:2 [Funneliformis geosporum]